MSSSSTGSTYSYYTSSLIKDQLFGFCECAKKVEGFRASGLLHVMIPRRQHCRSMMKPETSSDPNSSNRSEEYFRKKQKRRAGLRNLSD